MDPVGVDRHGDIDTVVNEQFCAECPCEGSEFLSEGKQFPYREVLFPELYRPHPALKRQTHRRHEGPLRYLPVGDKVEPEINGQPALLHAPRGNNEAREYGCLRVLDDAFMRTFLASQRAS
jgi:hypothetical protein